MYSYLGHFRYSEDLDYVRTTTGGIGAIMRRLTDMGRTLGYVVRTQIDQHPKVFWRYPTASGGRGKIKIEINTFERSPMLPLAKRTLDIASPWYECRQDIPTFQAEELVATKLRALYQRSRLASLSTGRFSRSCEQSLPIRPRGSGGSPRRLQCRRRFAVSVYDACGVDGHSTSQWFDNALAPGAHYAAVWQLLREKGCSKFMCGMLLVRIP